MRPTSSGPPEGLHASLLAASVAAIATGGVWLAVDGRGTCDPPSGARCERLYDTKAQGWIAIAVGGAAGVAGGLLLWSGHLADASLTAGPGAIGLRGHF